LNIQVLKFRFFLLVLLAAACASPEKLTVIQEGTASWYGPGFHGKKTASGEFYDSGALTAAHKTLPLGTIVTVVNKDNGRKTTVRINDRGPYVSGRIIDVSKAAAQQLGMMQTGTAPVKLLVKKAPGDENVLRAKASASAAFTVQLASYNTRKQAESKAKSYPDGWVSEARRDGALVYRVCSGRFSAKEDAERHQKSLAARGMMGFVKQID
jgi:rare lipoprotein A